MRTAVPDALMSRSSWKTLRRARSSRLPVGSSAMSTKGSFTSARDRDALLFASGQLARKRLRLGPEPDLAQHALDTRRDLVPTRADDLEREGNVVFRRTIL